MGTVLSEQKISDTEGGFLGILDDDDRFGRSLASLGDLDGDGVDELAVGAIRDDDGGANRGAVWILFLNADGTVKCEQKISDTSGGFGGALADDDILGISIAALGDLGGDGRKELTVGAIGTDGGGVNRGGLWILSLNTDGTVFAEQQIGDGQGGFTGALADGDQLGFSLAPLGDLDDDGVEDVAVGAWQDGNGVTDAGAVWILFLNADGCVKAEQKIASGLEGDFDGPLQADDHFGVALASLGDLDGDGVVDLAVGAHLDDDGGTNRGAVWILFLAADGRVQAWSKISGIQGSFTGTLRDGDRFGASIGRVGDLDGDGVVDLAVGASQDDDGGTNRGATWILFLEADGTVKSYQKLSDTQGGFAGGLADRDLFGIAQGPIADVDGDGVADLAVGAHQQDDGGPERGALWVLFLDGAACGDGELGLYDGCDDASVVDGDGCSAICTIESSLSLYGLAQGGERVGHGRRRRDRRRNKRWAVERSGGSGPGGRDRIQRHARGLWNQRKQRRRHAGDRWCDRFLDHLRSGAERHDAGSCP